jgi:hypothetical protein
MAYKLELPPSNKIHGVMHVSMLKKHIPPSMVLEDGAALPVAYAAMTTGSSLGMLSSA